MDLGAFSLSLAVADLTVSQAFYERLGFKVIGGEADEGWSILRNGQAKIGLFCGMLDTSHILTFTPGWNDGAPIESPFTDVREIHRAVASSEVIDAAGLDGTGPAHFVIEDPDGNRIMFDQFVDRP